MDAQPSLKNARLEGWKILIIDDDEDDYVIVREMLNEAKGRQFDVQWASSYPAGREALLSGAFNAVLVDYDLGLHSGIDLIREATQRGCPAPLILYTGRGSYEIDVEAMQAGATLYLTKNEANPLLLERSIRYAIERKQSEQALMESNEGLRQTAEGLRKTSEALRKSEEKFARVFHASPVAISIATVDEGRFIEVNESFTQLYGYSRDEVVGRTSLEINLFPRQGDRHEIARQCRAGQGVRNRESQLMTKAGQTLNVLYSAEPMEVDGQDCLLSMVVDITERKRAEERLRESESRFQAALASAPISVYTTDRDLRLTWMHDFHPGFDPQSVLGLRLDEVLPGEYGQKLVAIQREVIGTGQAQKGEFESWLNDEHFYYNYFIDPIRSSGGEISGVACAGFEVTDRREAEAALKANAEALKANTEALKANAVALQHSIERERARAVEMETLMDTVPALIWIARDAECREMVGNRYGYEFLRMWEGANISKTAGSEDLQRQPYRNFKNGREIPTEALPMQVAAATGRGASNYDFDLVFNDGTVRTILGNVNPLFDEAGRPSGAVAAFIDITDQRRAQEQLQHYAQELERSNQSLQDFAFIASHDLQEPLRKVTMFGSSLRAQLKDLTDETVLDYLARMSNAAERMQTMINGLLELSRVNTRGGEFAPVQLGEVVSEVVSDLEARLKAVQGQVQIGPLPTLDADELQMRQLFQNLIGNAIKFHRPDVPPRVRVSGQVIEDGHALGSPKLPVAEIRVEDNGIGFDPASAPRIFQPFQRLHSRSEYEGTGLGLAICQKIVERHHGQIEVHSQPGAGATFTIRMPLKAGD